MDQLQVVNVVATGNLGPRLNFDEIYVQLDVPFKQYDPSVHQGMYLRFEEDGPLITLYNSGKFIVRASTRKQTEETHDRLCQLLYDIDILPQPEVEEFAINNVVLKGSLNREFDLEAVAEDLQRGNIEYNHDKFPGLIYRVTNQESTTITLFRTGNVTIVGSKTVAEAEQAFGILRDEVHRLLESETDNH